MKNQNNKNENSVTSLRKYKKFRSYDGFMVCFLIIVLASISLHYGNNPLFLFCTSIFATIIVFSLYSVVSLKKISATRELPQRINAGENFMVHVNIKNNKSFFPVIGLGVIDSLDIKTAGVFDEIPVFYIPSKGNVRITCSTSFRWRGKYEFSEIFFKNKLALSLSRKIITEPCYSNITVYPQIGQLNPQLMMKLGQKTGDLLASRNKSIETDDFYGMHEYRHGDNPKHIHWKSSAKMDKLMVKEYIKYQIREVVIFLDQTVPEQKGHYRHTFERMIVFTASLVSELIRNNYRIHFCTGGDNPFYVSNASGRETMDRIMEFLATVKMVSSESISLSDELKSNSQGNLGIFISLRNESVTNKSILQNIFVDNVWYQITDDNFRNYFTSIQFKQGDEK